MNPEDAVGVFIAEDFLTRLRREKELEVFMKELSADMDACAAEYGELPCMPSTDPKKGDFVFLGDWICVIEKFWVTDEGVHLLLRRDA